MSSAAVVIGALTVKIILVNQQVPSCPPKANRNFKFSKQSYVWPNLDKNVFVKADAHFQLFQPFDF